MHHPHQQKIADYNELLDHLIRTAFLEDIGDGDHTSLSVIPENWTGAAELLIKDEGVIAGIEVAKKVFQTFDPELQFEAFLSDGSTVSKGQKAFRVSGRKVSILQTERLVLNIMQRMSGIATQTAAYCERIAPYKTQILDTRKTTPGMRILDKEAVRLGGGANHRMGLYDMIMIKDNHIDFAGGIEAAITRVKTYLREKDKSLAIEVEARNLNDVKEIVRIGGIHRIMLDNFSLEETREAVQFIHGCYETESSGGITYDTIADYAACGVDFISVGALTHQIKSLDLSLKASE